MALADVRRGSLRRMAHPLVLLLVLGAQTPEAAPEPTAPAEPAEGGAAVQAAPPTEDASAPGAGLDASPPPPTAPAPIEVAPRPAERLLVLNLEAQGVEAALAETLTAVVVEQLSHRRELVVLSGKDLRDLVSLSAERQQLGECNDDSCLAEVAAAMGARYVVSGQVGQLGRLTVVTLSLFDADAGAAIGRQRVEMVRIEEATRRLGPHVHNLVADLLGLEPMEPPPPPVLEEAAAAPPPAATVDSPSGLLSVISTLSLVGGAAVAIAAAGLGGVAYAGTIGGSLLAGGVRSPWAYSLVPVVGPLLHIGTRSELDFPSRVIFFISFGCQTAALIIVAAGATAWGTGWYLSPDDEDGEAVSTTTTTGGLAPGRRLTDRLFPSARALVE